MVKCQQLEVNWHLSKIKNSIFKRISWLPLKGERLPLPLVSIMIFEGLIHTMMWMLNFLQNYSWTWRICSKSRLNSMGWTLYISNTNRRNFCIDQSNVIVFIWAYWPHDNNFDHVTFYCGWQKTFRSMQWPLSRAIIYVIKNHLKRYFSPMFWFENVE